MKSTLPKTADMLMALPIAGESFLLRRSGKRVLVDGGYKKDNIAGVLESQFPDVSYLDVVVCTHGDSDHAGGLPELLNTWGRRVGQLWLPGRWVDVVPRLVRDPAEFFNQLIRELDVELREPSEGVISIIRDADDDEVQLDEFEDRDNPPDDVDLEPMDGRIDSLDLPLDTIDIEQEPEWFIAIRRSEKDLTSAKEASSAYVSARRKVKYRLKRSTLENKIQIAHYWLDLIETAEAIRKIAIAAINHKIPTRWFDFQGFQNTRHAKGGASGFLVPVNAVEQSTPPTNLTLFMHLTQINQESLVFLAPPAEERLGVLFCADSPLGDGPNFGTSFLRPIHFPNGWLPMVATTPHHGSESNSAAYGHLRHWANITVLLRAGGSKKQPGATFLSQHSCLRLCTKCPKFGHAPLLSGVFLCQPYRRPHQPWLSSQLVAFGRRCVC
jgi:hypothetical protein